MRVGVIGLGRIGLYHARILRAHPDVDALSVIDVDPDRTRAAAEELDADPASSVDELLGRVDAVAIATSTDTHAALIHAGVDAGLPVFCEKPVALDLASTMASSRTSGRRTRSCRSASSVGSTPVTRRPGRRCRREIWDASTSSGSGATTPTRRTRATSPDPAASSATCTSTISTSPAGCWGRTWSRSTPRAPSSPTPCSRGTATSTRWPRRSRSTAAPWA